jgi:hypothetical protein
MGPGQVLLQLLPGVLAKLKLKLLVPSADGEPQELESSLPEVYWVSVLPLEVEAGLSQQTLGHL